MLGISPCYSIFSKIIRSVGVQKMSVEDQDHERRVNDGATMARMETTMHFQAKAMEGITHQMRELRDIITGNHDTLGTKVNFLEKGLSRVHTTISVSRWWLGVILTIMVGVQGLIGWALSEFWKTQTGLNRWKVESEMRWAQHDRGINYGNEGNRSVIGAR